MTIGHEPDWRGAWAELRAGPLVEGQAATYVHVAQMLAARGHRVEAAAALHEALRHDPHHLPSLRFLASLSQAEGEVAMATKLRRRVVTLELAGLNLEERALQEATAFRQALAGDAPPPERVPTQYLAARFDAWAENFEHDLRDRLRYCGPELLHATLVPLLGPATASRDVLDLGCGTGLTAPLLRPWARHLYGVDLSPKMLEQARRRQLYDQLEAEDLGVVLQREARRWDLIVAAEVFNYLGNLANVFAAAARALRPAGFFAFTVEDHDETGYRLCPTGRYVHSLGYLREQAEAVGLTERHAAKVVLRFENDRPVDGHVVVLQRPEKSES